MNAWKPKDESKVVAGRVVSDGLTASFSYPCSSSWDCTPYSTTLPAGMYKVEVWGARGGAGYQNGYLSNSSPGGYSVGVLHLTKASPVYVYIGGHGEDGLNPASRSMKGGFNGGGDTAQDTIGSNDDQSGGGGGASDIRVDVDDFDHRVIVAGGGGGAGFSSYDYSMLEVGYGGGLTAGPPKSSSSSGKTKPADQNYGYQKGKGEDGFTPIDVSPPGDGGGGYWGGTISYYSGHGGGGSGFIGKVTDFQEIKAESIPGNKEITLLNGQKSTGNNGDGAARITMIGYVLTKVSKIDEIYSPGSEFNITFEVNTLMNPEEESRIFRKENESEEVKIDTHKDDGSIYRFTDSFSLPNKSGFFNITYSVSTKSNSRTSVTYQILINSIPRITALTNLSTVYKSDSSASIDVIIEDDTFVDLILVEKSINRRLRIDTFQCYNKENNKIKFDFKIPAAPLDSSHTVSLYSVDEFGYSSNMCNFTYKIVDVYFPEIRLTRKIPYAFTVNQQIPIFGEFRDPDAPSKVYIVSTNDGVNRTEHRMFDVSDDRFHEFSFKFDTRGISADAHELHLFSFTTVESTPIIIKYALLTRYSEVFINFASCGCLASFIRFSIFFTNIFLDTDTLK